MEDWEETVSTQKISQQAENLSESHDHEVRREEGMRHGQESTRDMVSWHRSWGQEDGPGETIDRPQEMPMHSFLEMLISEVLIGHLVAASKK